MAVDTDSQVTPERRRKKTHYKLIAQKKFVYSNYSAVFQRKTLCLVDDRKRWRSKKVISFHFWSSDLLQTAFGFYYEVNLTIISCIKANTGVTVSDCHIPSLVSNSASNNHPRPPSERNEKVHKLLTRTKGCGLWCWAPKFCPFEVVQGCMKVTVRG